VFISHNYVGKLIILPLKFKQRKMIPTLELFITIGDGFLGLYFCFVSCASRHDEWCDAMGGGIRAWLWQQVTTSAKSSPLLDGCVAR
jgi:hypothetical protein